MSHLRLAVKQFRFAEYERSRIILSSASIRLAAGENRVVLTGTRSTVTGGLEYSTSDGISVLTWTSNPQAVRAWVGFQVDADYPKAPDGTNPTAITYRVSDGATERYWNGSAWVTATTNAHYNTEAEVRDNIASYPVSLRAIAFRAKLRTTDKRFTPVLRAIVVGMRVDIDLFDDLLARSVVPLLRGRQLQVRYAVRMATTASTIDLSSATYKPAANYKIVGVAAAFNLTTDPNRMTDVLSSFVVGTQVVTLIGSATVGQAVQLELLVEPEVLVAPGHQDYVEVEKVPAYVLESTDIQARVVHGVRSVRVTGGSTAHSLVQRHPFRATLTVGILLLAESTATWLRMQTTLLRLVTENAVVRSVGLDENYSMRLMNEGTYRARPNLSEAREATATLAIEDVMLYLGAETDETLVAQVLLSAAGI